MTADQWISLEDERPRPNSRIAVKGFKRDNPGQQVVSADVHVDSRGFFSTSADVQDTHWRYAGDGIVITAT